MNAILRKSENPMKIVNCMKTLGGERKQAQKLEKIEYKAIRGTLGCWSCTPINAMLAEAKETQFLVGSKSLEGTICPDVIGQAVT
jgi:hypothetical protein